MNSNIALALVAGGVVGGVIYSVWSKNPAVALVDETEDITFQATTIHTKEYNKDYGVYVITPEAKAIEQNIPFDNTVSAQEKLDVLLIKQQMVAELSATQAYNANNTPLEVLTYNNGRPTTTASSLPGTTLPGIINATF